MRSPDPGNSLFPPASLMRQPLTSPTKWVLWNRATTVPRVEDTLASHLLPSLAPSWKSRPLLPTKPCRTTSALIEKSYITAGQAGMALHTMAILQSFQVDVLKEMNEGDGLTPEAVKELRKATDLALRATKHTARAEGRSMAGSVAAEHHLWLNLTEISWEGFSQTGLFGEAVSSVVEKFRSAKSQSAALKQCMPRRMRDPSNTPSPSLTIERSLPRKELTTKSCAPAHPPRLFGLGSPPFPHWRLRGRVNLKPTDRPTALAPPSRPWPSDQDEESVLRYLTRQGQTVQMFLPASNTLSSLRSVTPTPRGLVCRKSPSASAYFSVAFGRRIRLSPLTTRSFAASGPRDRRHSRFYSTAYWPHTGHFSVQCFALHHPEQGRQRLYFVVEDVTFSRPSRHPNTGMSSTSQNSASSIAFLSRMGASKRGIALGSPHSSVQLHTSVWPKPPLLRWGSPDGSKQRLEGFCATTGTFLPPTKGSNRGSTSVRPETGCGVVFEGRPAHSVWTGEFLSWHMNCLELRAVFLALIHFLPFLRRCHKIVRTDNMVVVSHINHQGGSRSRTLNRLAPSSPLVSGQVPLPESGSRSGSFELCSQFSVEAETQAGGMDVEPSDSSPDLGSVRRSGRGPLCIAGVVPMPALVLPESPGTFGHILVSPSLAEHDWLKHVQSQVNSGSPVQGEGERCPSPTRSPVLAIPDMVLRADSSSGPALSASGQDLVSSARDLEAVGMAHPGPWTLISVVSRIVLYILTCFPGNMQV